MKIQIEKAVKLWNALSELKEINQALPSALSANAAYLRPEMAKWNELTIPERQSFIEAEIQVPLVKIKKEQLDQLRVPPDILPLLAPIIDGEIPPHKTEIEKLLESKNGIGDELAGEAESD